MKVSIVKYNAGNIFSVINSVKRLGIEPLWTDDPVEIASSDRVIFPGQGHARTAMEYLREHNLDKVIADLKQPVLGICIGQQLLCQHSEEGDTDCIGIFPVNVRRFQPTSHEQKVPAMGWNAIHDLKSPLNLHFSRDSTRTTMFISYTHTTANCAISPQQHPTISSPTLPLCRRIISSQCSFIQRRVER